jgi:ribosomal protein S18 acetylase RimI-like enzyme
VAVDPIGLADATAADEAVLFDLFCRARAADLGADAWDEELRARTLRLQYDAQRGAYQREWPALRTRLIVAGTRPIGWVTLAASPSSLHVLDLAIVPESQRQGAGEWVMRQLQDEAGREQRSMVLSVLRSNLPAIRLYARLGFRPVAADDLRITLEWELPARAEQAEALPTDPAVYRRALNTCFDVQDDTVPLLLTEVHESAPSGGMRRFSLLFHGPGTHPLSQGTYSLHHPELGTLRLFIVPVVGSTDASRVYEACFSAPLPASA